MARPEDASGSWEQSPANIQPKKTNKKNHNQKEKNNKPQCFQSYNCKEVSFASKQWAGKKDLKSQMRLQLWLDFILVIPSAEDAANFYPDSWLIEIVR